MRGVGGFCIEWYGFCGAAIGAGGGLGWVLGYRDYSEPARCAGRFACQLSWNGFRRGKSEEV